jgi:hypothetical protein
MEDKAAVTPILTPSSEAATFDIGSIQVGRSLVFICVCVCVQNHLLSMWERWHIEFSNLIWRTPLPLLPASKVFYNLTDGDVQFCPQDWWVGSVKFLFLLLFVRRGCWPSLRYANDQLWWWWRVALYPT